MKRGFWTLPLCLLILGLSCWMAHAVYYDHSHVTAVAKGDAANPLSFMTAQELARTEAYSRIKDALYFFSIGFEWVVYLFLLGVGLSGRFRNAALRFFKRSTLGQVTIYTVLFQAAVALLNLPLQWYRHMVDVNYGLSNMTPGAWFQEWLVSLAVDTALLIPVIWLVYFIVRKSPKRWWLWFWAASIPLLVFLMVIQPVVLDPLYNQFQPLPNSPLKTEILNLAHQANIPAHDVYQVDMSAKTNALNAYVNGIGPSARIVLWDTTLKSLRTNEILFIMGHEMGHYVMNHMIWGLASMLLTMLLIFYLLAKLLNGFVRWFGHGFGVAHMQDLAVLPAAFFLLAVLNFAGSPLDNYFSRMQEHAADQYAVQITHDPHAGITSFQKLARLSLSDPNPPELVKFFRYTHPTITERIEYLEQCIKTGKAQ